MDTVHLLAEIEVLKHRLENAVEVVRCKDCRYKDDCEQEVLLSDMYGEVEDTAHITYCSYGEREGE